MFRSTFICIVEAIPAQRNTHSDSISLLSDVYFSHSVCSYCLSNLAAKHFAHYIILTKHVYLKMSRRCLFMKRFFGSRRFLMRSNFRRLAPSLFLMKVETPGRSGEYLAHDRWTSRKMLVIRS